jgi:hypothetical protein
MIFEPRQKIERLKTIDAKLLEKIIVGAQTLARHFEVLRRERENLLRGFLEIWHRFSASNGALYGR